MMANKKGEMMRYKMLVFICLSEFCTAPSPMSGLLSSSDLSQNIFQTSTKKTSQMSLSGQLTASDLSKVVFNKISPKNMVRLSGLLSANQLNSVIQFMYAKQQKAKNISGMISSKDLDNSTIWQSKKRKPRANLSGLMVQNYLDPDYQAAFKILDNVHLQQEYDAELEAIQTYFKEYYLSQPTSEKKPVINLPKICCSDQNQNYTLCQTEQ
jgi:hypothetical protein